MRSSAGSTASSARATDGYVDWCHHLIRKSALALLLLAGIAVLAGFFGSRLPTSFLPEEDQGYFYMNVQLPNAASLQRTDAVCRQIEAILADTRACRPTTPSSASAC